ncbi:hypothetical protein MKZ38_001670 [Zalerion maritima]|uniref:Uncharacterized protein n=1 Tax=Zalerion maritima TaxID=339359 RepID=A0AAD5RFA7_9PEZI|nr:hypothetical protein MKZ38_001670 [Zalerion maritima]
MVFGSRDGELPNAKQTMLKGNIALRDANLLNVDLTRGLRSGQPASSSPSWEAETSPYAVAGTRSIRVVSFKHLTAGEPSFMRDIQLRKILVKSSNTRICRTPCHDCTEYRNLRISWGDQTRAKQAPCPVLSSVP